MRPFALSLVRYSFIHHFTNIVGSCGSTMSAFGSSFLIQAVSYTLIHDLSSAPSASVNFSRDKLYNWTPSTSLTLNEVLAFIFGGMWSSCYALSRYIAFKGAKLICNFHALAAISYFGRDETDLHLSNLLISLYM